MSTPATLDEYTQTMHELAAILAKHGASYIWVPDGAPVITVRHENRDALERELEEWSACHKSKNSA